MRAAQVAGRGDVYVPALKMSEISALKGTVRYVKWVFVGTSGGGDGGGGGRLILSLTECV